ncbi:MAG TPA: calcium-translocating P-type ATPase, PMCA-type, partial [Gemmataceae bacterium]|nr:calcium-translocating P-type ATPase, PMCA-type [Gemmataceae bacterium]
MRTQTDILQEFPGAAQGLTPDHVEQSRRAHGSNQLPPPPRLPHWQLFLDKFDESIIKILLAAALLSMLVELLKPPLEALRHGTGFAFALLVAGTAYLCYARERKHFIPTLLFVAALILWPMGLAFGHASFDGLAVMIAVILATGVAFLSEYKSDREFEALNKPGNSVRCKIRRSAEIQALPLSDVVVGDTIVLEMGDEIPADGRVLLANDLNVDQSLLTGETEPVSKAPQSADNPEDGSDNASCVFRGTHVVEGRGEMLVCAVGAETALGQIASRLADIDLVKQERHAPGTTVGAESERVRRKLNLAKEQTPLQEKLERLAQIISTVGYSAAGAIFFAQIVQGIWWGNLLWPGQAEGFFQDLMHDASMVLGYFMYMVIIVVVAVPEGLPMSVTVSLALAMRKMTRANCLVRQLVACETVGSTTVICSDKTGTITQNRMRVVHFGCDGLEADQGDARWLAPAPDEMPLATMLLNGAVNSTAHLERKGSEYVTVGNSTEGALLFWLQERKLDYQAMRSQFPALVQLHFSSERKRMTTVIEVRGRRLALVKGAPEWLLERSGHFLNAHGREQAMTPVFRAQILAGLARAARHAMRALGFAYATVATDLTAEALVAQRGTLDEKLVFVGYVAIRDPVRQEVPEALARCRHAGIGVKMITGDNIGTARAIATEIGLLNGGGQVLTSPEFNALDDEALKRELPSLRVVARAQPLDKYRLVRLLQELGEVVAVTGDGTNDAPALKKADVGLAMGRAGTEVAKEASKIILLDDSFATIVNAVHWGRALYENIQRFLQFQLTINVSALAIAFLGILCGFKPPFTILQLLWINVIMDTLAAIALCSEPPRPGLMRLPPKRRDDSVVTRPMLWTIASTAAFFIVVMMSLLLLMRGTPEHPGWFAGTGPWSETFPNFTIRQGTIFFTVYVLFQVWNEVNCRSLVPEVSGLHGLKRNPVFLVIAAIIVGVQALIVSFGGSIFQVERLGPRDWLLILIATASVLIYAELVRGLRKFMAKE